MVTLIRLLGLAVVLLQLSQSIDSAKIFGYLLAAGRSHFIIHDSLLRGLAAKGHDVSLYGSTIEISYHIIEKLCLY